MMLMYGSNIQSPADQLQKVQESYLYHSLVCPKPHVVSAMQQLRTVYTLDANRYAQLKRQLPYFVCGMFNPPFRRSENFAYTERFILDFDHLASKNLSLASLREKISADSRVLMCFASPSEDGLKVMFGLKERCYDRGIYTLFYKAFAKSFAQQIELEQVLDTKTSDVTRACFVSVDSEAYYNEHAEPVELSAFVNADNPLSAFDLKREQAKEEKESKQSKTPTMTDPTKDVMEKIRATLRPTAPAMKRQAFIPTQLDDIIAPLQDYIRQTGIEVKEVINIQYAKKIRAAIGLRQAEVNLFYGKRGYSVVESPRRGTDDEFNKLLADVIKSFLADQSQLPY